MKALKVLCVSVLLPATSLAGVKAKSWDFNTARDFNTTEKIDLASMRRAVFSNKYSFEKRWASVSKFASVLSPFQRKEFLIECMNVEEWFIKSPALKIMKQEDKVLALKWARKLLKEDKALVVRSDAVAIINDLRDEDSADLLWEELFARKNFKGSSSLWIRPQIVKALRRLDRNPKKAKWESLLADSDPKIKTQARLHLKATNF